MRRNALAPVPQNAVNSRNSMSMAARNPRHKAPSKPHDARRASAIPAGGGPGRAVGAGRVGADRRSTTALPQRGRVSSSAMRASLAPGGGRRGAGAKDPKPLTSRAHLQDNIQRLQDFLMRQNYEPVTMNQLSNPTSRDFVAMFSFIMRLIDPCFDFVKPFQEEIPALLKCLNYPFSLSKSALSAIGSPHAWPTLLGVLVWLTGLVTYNANCETQENNAAGMDKVTSREHFFHQNNTAMYVEYLEFKFDTNEDTEYDAELENYFRSTDEDTAKEVSKLRSGIETLSQTLKALSTEESPLTITVAQSKDLSANQEKLRVLLAKMHEHFRVISAKGSELDADISTARTALQEIVQERAPVVAALQRQKDSAIDAERMAADRDALKEGLMECAKQMVAVRRALSVGEERMTAAQDVFSTTLAEYHRELDMLAQASRIGDTGAADREDMMDATDLQKCRVKMSRDASVVDAHELLGRRNGEDLASGLEGVAERLRAGIPGLQERALRLSEEVDELEERLIMQRDEQTLRQSQLKKRTADYVEGKETLTKALSERSKTILEREEEMLQARRVQEAKIREVQRQNDMLRDQLKVLREKFAASREHYAGVLAEDVKLLRMHQEDMLEALTAMRRQFEHSCAQGGIVIGDDEDDAAG